jgi:hypothetical protein
MAQHDYIISNQGFPATRADINNVLNSIATLNSGTSAPSTQYAGQMWIDTTTATNWILYIYDGADNIQIATINTSTNTVNFTDSALDVLTDTTPQLGGNLDVNGNSIVSTSNANITLAPDGTGDVVLSADTVKIGDSNANATITTDGTGDLILNTNSGSSSGSITIADGANANITIEPNGTGDVLLNADTVRVGDSGANATITSNGAGDLILNTNSGTDSGSITIADGANGNITVAGNGTGQIVVNAGAVGTPVIAPTGDLNTGIFFPSADTIAFTEGGTEAMRIDSSGNVGINTTSPTTKVQIFSDGAPAASGNMTTGMAVASASSSFAINIGADATAGYTWLNSAYISSSNTASPMVFMTGATERMRITSTGALCVGGSNANGPSIISSVSTGVNTACYANLNTAGSGSHYHYFINAGNSAIIGSITNNGNTGTAFNTSSDYRLKENVNYNFDATTRLKQLKPARFNFIASPNKTVDGFLAHEVQNIIPEAITGNKDQTLTKEKVVINSNGGVIAENIEQSDWEAGKILNEQGESQYPIDSTWEASKIVPVYQGIDQAKLTPILTKALQEAIAKIESLEARLTALESK